MNGSYEKRFLVVEPWGNDPVHQASILSDHDTVETAFAARRIALAQLQRGNPAKFNILVIDRTLGAVCRSQASLVGHRTGDKPRTIQVTRTEPVGRI